MKSPYAIDLDSPVLTFCRLVFVFSFYLPHHSMRASLIAQLSEESACSAGGPGEIPGLGGPAGEGTGCPLQDSWLPGGSAGKESACSVGELGFPQERSPGERMPTPVFWPGEFHGVRGVAECWARLSDSYFHFHCHHTLLFLLFLLIKLVK